jgi:outer membrane protein
MKKTLILFTLLMVVAGAVMAQDALTKIGVINLDRVMAETEMGVASRSSLETFRLQKENEFKAEVNQLRTEVSQLESQRSILSAEAAGAKQNELQQRELQLQQKGKDIERQLQTMQQAELEKFFNVAGPVVEAIGKEMGFAVVYDHPNRRGTQIVYFNPDLDITDVVIERVNSASK